MIIYFISSHSRRITTPKMSLFWCAIPQMTVYSDKEYASVKIGIGRPRCIIKYLSRRLCCTLIVVRLIRRGKQCETRASSVPRLIRAPAAIWFGIYLFRLAVEEAALSNQGSRSKRASFDVQGAKLSVDCSCLCWTKSPDWCSLELFNLDTC